MDKKDLRDSVVPVGTFASSVAPPRRASVQAPNSTTSDTGPVEMRPVRSSSRGAPPSQGESERKRVRTLLGVPTPSVDALTRSDKGGYPSPPKWKPGSRQDTSSAPQGLDALPVAKIELRQSQRVAQRPPAPPSAVDSATANISDAIQQMLDEQSAVSLEVEEETTPLDLVLESELQVLPDSVPPPGAIPAAVPVVAVLASAARVSDAKVARTSVPVLMPEHIALAHARDQDRSADETVRTRTRPELLSLDEERALALDAGPASSLAPAEVRRPVPRDDAAPALGFMMVAAIALLAVGGWLFTAGGYERPNTTETRGLAAAASPPATTTTAPVAIPLPAQAAAAPSATVVPPLSAAPAAVATLGKAAAAVAPVTALPRTKTLPLAGARRSIDTARSEPSPPSAAGEAAAAQTGPVMKITMVGQPPAAPSQTQEVLPEVPSRDDVLARLEGVRSAVQACAEGKTGVAELDITIAGTGAITTVLVGGDFAGSAQGSCIARTVRQTRFPRFQKERFRLLFPYSI